MRTSSSISAQRPAKPFSWLLLSISTGQLRQPPVLRTASPALGLRVPVAASGASVPGAIIKTATTSPNCVGVESGFEVFGSRFPETVEQPFYLQTTSTSLGPSAGGLGSNALNGHQDGPSNKIISKVIGSSTGIGRSFCASAARRSTLEPG